MTLAHKLVLQAALALLGLSLLVPGAIDLLRANPASSGLVAGSADARSHLRALNAMIAALGLVALWACWDVERARLLVLALGVVMAVLALGRLYAIAVDGMPGPITLVYLAVEAALAALFLLWPPPAV